MVDEPDLDVTAVPQRSSRSSPGSAPGDSRAAFTAGEILAERYRIVGLLGRGGMGEAYRAEDLTLDQPVALKFLPPSVDRNPEQLERLRAEVRLTRQVSHPNVCRVYHIGSASGRSFLTMEYVDGEDLSSLLQRIGRLPADKGIEIARQLCAGLAAAHDRGIVHRDLKPANVMLDGRGKVRIMDFGLAIVGERGANPQDWAGTPAYMAPEQLAGQALSAQTDIYALGLVLYEVLTGRRMIDAHSIDEIKRAQADSHAIVSSTTNVNLDPAVARVILRCVEFGAARRPESALAVAAALPGADPLAAALAAGETPSPTLVAAAGDDTIVAVPIAAAILAFCIVGVGLDAIWTASQSAFTQLRPPYSGEVLGIKAREMLGRLGYDDGDATSAAGFDIDQAYIRYVREDPAHRARWTRLRGVKPPPIVFWQRTSPAPLAPTGFPGGMRVSETDPPRVVPGMTLLETDLDGRLARFEARPPESDQAAAGAPAPWPALFREAGLDLEKFAEASAERVPPAWGDARAAWTGAAPDDPNVTLRVEAAAYHSRPIFFSITAPWTPKPGAPPRPTVRAWQRAVGITFVMLLGAMIVTALLMARFSVTSGRADRRGAARLAAFIAIMQLAASLLVMAHVASVADVILVWNALAWPLIVAVLVWVLYVALEPYIRRTWPSALISWNRLIDGRVRDARIGRDVLIGVAATAALDVLDPLQAWARGSGSGSPSSLNADRWLAAATLREAIGQLASNLNLSIFVALTLVFLYCLLRMVVRREWIAMTILALVFAGLGAVGSPSAGVGTFVSAVLLAAIPTALVFVFVKFGLVTVIAFVFSGFVSNVVSLNPSAWYSTPSLINLAIAIGIAVYGFRLWLTARRVDASAMRRWSAW